VTVQLWRIATDTLTYEAHDMTGTGAKNSGGRWNAAGTAVVYTSTNRALASLETFVHLNSAGLPLNRYLVEIDVPEDIWAARRIEQPATLPVGWDAEPAGIVSVALGTQWVVGGATALLVVPSVMVPEELNVLINPAHPETSRISARKIRKWVYDPRLDRQISVPSTTRGRRPKPA
jgi:RES domain-containing protein